MSKNKVKATDRAKADGPQTTEEENHSAMAPGMDDAGPESNARLELVGVPTGEDKPASERTGADIIADLLNVKVRLECERAKWEGIEADGKKAWDVLADELGKRAKGQHQTRVPVRIGGTVYDFKYTKATASYSLIEAATPGEIK